MDKLGDIDLFVKIVKNKGFAAAARAAGMSPASVTIKVNRLEEYYGVRLLNRTTRRVALTEEGKQFYQQCLHILSELRQAEELLLSGRDSLCGSLKISAPVDLGQQYIAPALARFSEQNPGLSTQLNLTDGVVNLIEEGFDLGIRYGVLHDSRMVARRLCKNRRLLCASPKYVQRYGHPETPEDLSNHRCLTMIRKNEELTQWYFNTPERETLVSINPALSSNSGAQLRQWAISGYGIVLKSFWDIKDDLQSGRLLTLLDNHTQDFEPNGVVSGADLHIVYPSRAFLPERVRAFIDILIKEFMSLKKNLPSSLENIYSK